MPLTATPLMPDMRRRAHKARNVLQSILLVAGLGLLTSLCAWIVWGPQGILWTVIAVGLTIAVGPRVSPELVMSLYKARPITPEQGGDLYRLVEDLSRRAGLPALPRLHMIASSTLNAFAVGKPEQASIAVTTGLLHKLTPREVTGVLAHEISHIRNNDLWIMGLADTLSRLTQLMSLLGVFLLLLNLPAVMTGQVVVPWIVIALLYLAPTIGSLLQLALSRAREYDADLEGAQLTGDPAALASALDKLERYQGRFWEDMFFGGRKIPQPSLLRSHPPTQERIRRLMQLAHPGAQAAQPAPSALGLMGLNPAPRGPRYHWPGVWY